MALSGRRPPAAPPGAAPALAPATGSRRPGVDAEVAALRAHQAALAAKDRKAQGGNAVAQGFNALVGRLSGAGDRLGLVRAAAETALTRELATAFKAYRAHVASGDPDAERDMRAALAAARKKVQAYDEAIAGRQQTNKFWSGVTADLVAGVAVAAGVALTVSGVGAPIGVPLLAAGAFVGGGALAVGARAALDNQFDLQQEGLAAFAVGGLGGVGAALTGGASQALTAGMSSQAARVLGQEAVQGAAGRFLIGAGANATVGAGLGGATSGAQALASGGSLESVLKATALGAAGGAVGSVATSAVGAGLARGATALQRSAAVQDGLLSRAVSTSSAAGETAAGRAAGTLAQGVVTGASSGGAAALANQLASGAPLDYAALRDQILAGAIQGGTYAGVGLAGAALPRRAAAKAPPTPEETQRLLNDLAPAGQPALSSRHRQLAGAYRAAQAQALEQMQGLQWAARQLAGVTDPAQRAAALEQPVARYTAALQQLDGARGELLAFAGRHLPRPAALKVARAVGEPNPDVAWGRPLGAPTRAKHNEAVAAFVSRFPNLGLDGVAEPGVKGLSPRAIQAIAESLATEASSADAKGAANVEHLASVLQGVLKTSRAEKGAPLTQAEVDTRAAVTVLTDAWMKGASPEVLRSVRTASTNQGATGGQIYEGMLARGLKLASLAEVPEAIRPQLDAWFTRFGPPRERAEVAQALAAKGLPADQVEAWTSRIMARDPQITNPFLLGTWLHGLPQFDAVEHVVKSLGGDRAMARGYYEEVLAHHASGFVMDGFSRAGLTVDFYQMARAGQLTTEAAQRLTNLYTSSSTLAGKWRPVIDMVTSGKPLSPAQHDQFRAAVGLKPFSPVERQALGQGRPLTAVEYRAFRQRYAVDATPLRDAIAELPANSRSQLLNDDRQQFTVVGIPKWITMMATMGKPASNGALIDAVYQGAVQAYAEENYARGARVGTAFDQATAPVAQRLGMTFDSTTRTYRPAAGGEAAQAELARRVAADPALAARLAEARVAPTDAKAVIDWFRAQPADPEALSRLVGAP
ncbi:MAG: hypothetical protein VKS61_10315 [Candidatus Sericytochromatia bacterium]|nr:hypothetical protein [Candidatus Sericytochromatia bacterium]